MTQVPQELEAVRVKIPESLLSYNWDEAINANKGETANLLKVFKMHSEMLQKYSNWPVTPETLTWMTLWTRNFNLIQGAVSILASDVNMIKAGQEFSLRILWRPVIELWITLNFIYTGSAKPIRADETEKQTLEHRLCAYLAWCLWNDKEMAHKLTQGWRLDTLFGSGGETNLGDEEELKQIVEFYWGEEKVADPARDQEVKRRVRENSLKNRNQLRKWLQHEKLRDFEKQIRNKRPWSYFQLVEPENKSLASLLRSSWTDAGYPAYQEGSALIHGSTFLSHMEHINGHIFPHFASDHDEVQQQAGHIRRHCHSNALTIQWIQERMESEGLT